MGWWNRIKKGLSVVTLITAILPTPKWYRRVEKVSQVVQAGERACREFEDEVNHLSP